MDYKNIYYPESKFGGFTDIDGTITFYCRVNALIKPSAILLDIGCGRGSHAEEPIAFKRELRIFKGKCENVIGIDVDKSARTNPFIDEFRLIENDHWPLANESIDITVCDAVIEHIKDPDQFFRECHRVIKPGGYLCIRTGNVLSYGGIFSKLLPNKYHSSVIRKMQCKREDDDVFSTYYKCNTIKKMRYFFNKYDFDNYIYGYEAEPSYLSFSRFFYWLGVMHQRFAPRIFKLAIFGFGRKNH